MKKFATFAAIATLVFAAPAFATETTAEASAEVQASEGAIIKDNAAIAKQEANLAKNRAEKAAAKATGDSTMQAKESVSIGANHTAIGAKKVEKKIDEKILEHDKKDLEEAVHEGH